MELTGVVLRLLDDWGVEPDDQASLLGLPHKLSVRDFNRHRKGTPFPNDEATLTRISHLLSIERCVRTAFPHSAAMARLWVTTPQARFDNHTPLEVMLADGLHGMATVVSHLQCTEVW
jgi:hypothetical protein